MDNKEKLFELFNKINKNNLNEIYEESNVIEPQETKKSVIDGHSKESAIRMVYNNINPYTKGIFTDTAWDHVHKIFKILNEMNLDWYLSKNAEYDKEFPPKYKIWYFDIDFIDNKGSQKKIMGNLTAAGAGSVEDPLEKYDITVVLS